MQLFGVLLIISKFTSIEKQELKVAFSAFGLEFVAVVVERSDVEQELVVMLHTGERLSACRDLSV